MTCVGFVGRGFVGTAVYNTFKNYFTCETYDLDKSKCTVPSIKILMEKAKFIFVAVPTPVREDGSPYLDNIHSVYAKLNKYGDNHIIILKSSVSPGTSKMLNEIYKNVRTVFNPEFLKEATADTDFRYQDRIVLGGETEAVEQVEQLYRQVFPLQRKMIVTDWGENHPVPIYKTDTTTAELIKFYTNIMLACRVSISNEFFRMCEKLGINYNEVRDIACVDKRLNMSHTDVPGKGTPTSAPDFGFSGSCFNCNIDILLDCAKTLGLDNKIMKAIKERNETIDRKHNQDWRMEGKTIIFNKEKTGTDND